VKVQPHACPSHPPPVLVGLLVVAGLAAEANVERILRRATFGPSLAVVELENLDVAFTAVHTAPLVSQHDVDFHPLGNVAVVANTDTGGLLLRRTLLSWFKRTPSEIVLLLQAHHGTVHVLHQTVYARVGELPPPLFLGIVARLGLRSLRTNIVSGCGMAGHPKVTTVEPDGKQTVAHRRHADLLGQAHRLCQPPLPREQDAPPDLPSINGQGSDAKAGGERPLLER